MKTNLFYLFLITSLLMGLSACDDNDERHNKEMVVTIASEKKIFDGDFLFSPYWAKEAGDDKWSAIDAIGGFEHEDGYECVLRIWREKWHDGEVADASIYRYKLLETLSKVKKDSENIPSQHLFIQIASRKTGDPDMPYYARLGGENWKPFPNIEGFVHEVGHEYRLIISRNFQGSDAPAKFTYSYVSTSEDKEIDTSGLPQ
ncbi:DUF4377 domain-containing protein [Bacteroides sp. 51]|uniref:DUF4377 domain-containing protein n=1 Tax=Bacteroides sp. 51 TaxID=2302938 RepID=UPI0013D0B950|nr:DUF4377 domain-containing protein [Bacteroides sp. 51]NDV80675.1 DUF4377 domain-containing protein [Bacteroides sp. 51]